MPPDATDSGQTNVPDASYWHQRCRRVCRNGLRVQSARAAPRLAVTPHGSAQNCSWHNTAGARVDHGYTIRFVNEPVPKPDDLHVAASEFWLDADIDVALTTIKPYDGPDGFAIKDLTDLEWDRFVAALSE